MYARGSLSAAALLRINGDLAANQDVSIGNGADVTGNVAYGRDIVYTAGDIQGSVAQQADSVSAVPLPPATTFSHGDTDVSETGDLELQPGAYGDVVHRGLYKTIHLYSGDYYLRSLDVEITAYLHLHPDDGPINVFVARDMDMTQITDVSVNDEPVAATNQNLNRNLARNVYFETHGDASLGRLFDPFFGTVYAPNGSVTLGLNDMFGSIIAGHEVIGEVYLDHYPSTYLAAVPEPATLHLLAIACMAFGLMGRRRCGG